MINTVVAARIHLQMLQNTQHECLKPIVLSNYQGYLTSEETYRAPGTFHCLGACMSLSATGRNIVPQKSWTLTWKTYNACLSRQLGHANSMVLHTRSLVTISNSSSGVSNTHFETVLAPEMYIVWVNTCRGSIIHII